MRGKWEKEECFKSQKILNSQFKEVMLIAKDSSTSPCISFFFMCMVPGKPISTSSIKELLCAIR